MTIRKIVGFNHLPRAKTGGALATGYGMGWSGLGLTYTYSGAAGLGGCEVVDHATIGKPVLNTFRSSAFNGHATNIRIPLANTGIDVTKEVYFGTRLAVTNLTIVPILSLLTAGGSGGSGTVLFLLNEIPSASNFNPGHYIEIAINPVTGVVRRWINGIQIGSITLAAAVLTAFKAGTAWMGLGFQAPLTYATDAYEQHSYWWDMYFKDEEIGSETAGRMGPITVAPITLADVVAPDWTPSSGQTLLSALNTGIVSSATQATPLVTSGAAGTALEATLQTSIQAADVVLAVDLSLIAKNTTAAAGSVDAEIECNGVSSVPRRTLLATSMTHNVRIGAFEKAPDGTAWTKAKIQQTTVKISPVTGG